MEVCDIWLARDFLARTRRPVDIPACGCPTEQCPPIAEPKEPDMTTTDSLDQTALAYIGEPYPEWLARYRTNEDRSGPNHNDAINMLCLLEDAAEQIAELKAELEQTRIDRDERLTLRESSDLAKMVDAAREEVEARKTNEQFLADWVKRLKAELAEARQVIANRDAALAASDETHRIAQQIVTAALGDGTARVVTTAEPAQS